MTDDIRENDKAETASSDCEAIAGGETIPCDEPLAAADRDPVASTGADANASNAPEPALRSDHDQGDDLAFDQRPVPGPGGGCGGDWATPQRDEGDGVALASDPATESLPTGRPTPGAVSDPPPDAALRTTVNPEPAVLEPLPGADHEAAAGTAAVPPAAAFTEPDEGALRLAEALVFASATPVSARALSQLLPDAMDAEAVIAALRARYAGRGVELADVGNGVQFRTAPDLAARLRKVIEVPRRLPRVAMETLAIIAYHQPVTRAEVEDIRGTSLSQQTLDALLEAGLVAPKGRKESPGRPTLWGTTPQFLAQFGLKDMRELPRREDLLLEPPQPAQAAENRAATPEEQTVAPDR
jgi:segregation and condensation protein B